MTATNTKISSDIRLVHRARPVLISAQVAAFLGTNGKRVQRLKSGNAHRFREGEHLHTIRGDEVRAFRDYANALIPGLIAPSSCVLRLWLPLGVAQIARMLGGTAWDRYEMLAQSPVLSIEGAVAPVPSVRVDAPMVATAPDEPLVMSSREIADMAEKRHTEVMRDIRTMLGALEVSERKFASANFQYEYLDAQGKPRPEYRLPKDLTPTLVSGYDVERRYRIVKRLEALEQGTVPLPAIAALEDGEIAHIAYLAENLRRAQDAAQRIGAPLDSGPVWGWIVERVARPGALASLAPQDATALLADIANLPFEARCPALTRGGAA